MKNTSGPRKPRPRRRDTRENLAAGESAVKDLAEGVEAHAGLTNDLAQFQEFKRMMVTMAAEQSLQTIRGLASAVTADLDLRAVVRKILEAGIRASGAERGIVFLGRGPDAGLVPVLAMNIEGDELLALDRISRTILRRGQDGQQFVTKDALLDPDLKDVESVRRNQVRSVLCLPLQSRSGLIGALYLDAPAAGIFGPDAERLLGVLADVAAAVLQNARVHGDLVRENALLRRQQDRAVPTERLVGSSPAVETLRLRADAAAQLTVAILITGAPGTGRRLLARVIHDGGVRALGPFVACDCSAVPPDLLKGVLLGRSGVAASGVQTETAGLLQDADRGTLVLQNAELLGKGLSEQLARTLRQGIYRAMGGRKDERIDLRLVLITARDLHQEVKRGRFSDELYRRVSGLPLPVPPLRERIRDIPELVAHFTRLYHDDRAGGAPVTFTPEALRLLAEQPWPGNVGELELVVRRALHFTERTAIGAVQVRHALLPITEEEDIARGPWSGKVLTLAEWEKEAIRQALIVTGRNRAKASALLGVHRNTIVRKIKEMGL